MTAVLARDAQGFKQKVQRLDGDLADYWSFFVRRCKAHPAEHPVDLAIAFLGTGDDEYARLFSREFERFISSLPARDLTNQGQFHAWTNSLPLVRWVLAYDLVADAPSFHSFPHEQAARAFLGYAERILWPVVRSRLQTGDNQFFSVDFGSYVIGHIFGRSRFQSALGAAMADHAAHRLADAVGHLPPGGYSGEGYYHNQVVATLASLYDAFLEGQTGGRLFDYAHPPSGVSIRDILTVDYHTILPGGLMVPWDASYFHPLHVKMNLAYLARQTGEARFLGPFRRYRLFEGDPRPGWGRDDDAWTWLWWPDSVCRMEDIPDDPLPNWARDQVAFGLIEREGETGIFQNFDESHRRHSPSASRAQSDPNNLVVIGRGSPLTLDGGFAKVPPDLVQTPDERRGRTGTTAVGFHNCLVIDGQMGAGTPAQTSGRLLRFIDTPVLAFGEADVTSHYRDYGVTEVVRRTLQLGSGLFFVVDRVKAPEEHDVTWHVFVRPYARLGKESFVVESPEAVRLTLMPLAGEMLPPVRVKGMPVVLENEADLVRIRARGKEVVLRSLLKIDTLSGPVADLTDDWEVAIDAEGTAASKGWLRPTAAWPVAGRVNAQRNAAVQIPSLVPDPLPQRFIWDYMDRREDVHVGRYDAVSFRNAVWLRRAFTVPREAGGKALLLRLSNPPWYVQVFLDGTQVAGHGMPSATGFGQAPHVAPAVVRLMERAKAGARHEIVVVIATPYPSTSLGTVTLEIPEDPAALTVENAGGPVVQIRAGERQWTLLPDNPGRRRTEGGTLATDSVCAVVKGPGEWAAAEATTFDLNGRAVLRSRYGWVTSSYQSGEFTVAEIQHDAICECVLPEGRLVVFGGTRWQVLAMLTHPLQLRVPPSADNAAEPVVAGWGPAAARKDGEMFVCCLVPAAEVEGPLQKLATGDAFERVESLHALAGSADARAVRALIGALDDPRWTVRCAAARVLGERMETDAVGALLRVLAGEQARDVYDGITDQNLFPQWPGGSNADELKDFGQLPVEARDVPEPGAVSELLNRFRLKQAVVEALGLIGDRKAVPAIRKILEPDQGPGGLGMTGGDFYPVRKAAAEALGRIGDPSTLDLIRRIAETETEVNTRYAAQQAVAWLTTGQSTEEFR